MSKAWAKGSTAQWRRTRALVLAKNHYENQGKCTLAIPEVCTGEATQVHHTKGRGVTGDDIKYLVATCGPCNRRVGQPGRGAQPKRISNW